MTLGGGPTVFEGCSAPRAISFRLQSMNTYGGVGNKIEGSASPCLCLHAAFFPQDLAKAFQEEAQASGKNRLLLTAAVPNDRGQVDAGYEVDKIAL